MKKPTNLLVKFSVFLYFISGAFYLLIGLQVLIWSTRLSHLVLTPNQSIVVEFTMITSTLVIMLGLVFTKDAKEQFENYELNKMCKILAAQDRIKEISFSNLSELEIKRLKSILITKNVND